MGDTYYLGTCATCGGLLGRKGETLDRVIAGRDLRFCADECAVRFQDDLEPSFARIDRVMIADQVPHYPLNTSIVSGKALGPRCVDFIVGNRLFRVYDHGERERVEADPVRYIKSLDKAAIAAQTPTYGMPAKCPVQGDILESDTPIDLVVANRMVRVCCMQCLFVVKGKPSQYLSMVDYANREAATHRTRE